jgi:hypothetical protein
MHCHDLIGSRCPPVSTALPASVAVKYYLMKIEIVYILDNRCHVSRQEFNNRFSCKRRNISSGIVNCTRTKGQQ